MSDTVHAWKSMYRLTKQGSPIDGEMLDLGVVTKHTDPCHYSGNKYYYEKKTFL